MNPQHLLIALALLLVHPTWAGPGHDHDHDHDAPNASAPAQPRFVASSELFELVGVLEGKALTLYLDRADSNAPVTAATLELELAGAQLKPQPQADGSFRAELAAVPAAGVHAVTATVMAGEDADLLAGELDLHGQAHEEHEPRNWKRLGLWAGFALLALIGAGTALRMRQKGGAA
ncbi:hypothetical protein [Inhella proteolytica]|uniref:Nickel transport protein n=1 Tax=Inhella proteolytica TaxID=2795029 RepID=A0A931J2Y2_9BURK|nr:hypothetical protein [Inhella proteolytica]MBH9576584.1 hypothetical protein [Inhella proteolytica]